MSETTTKEVTLTEAKSYLTGLFRYLLSKWLWIGLIGIAFGLIGIYYAYSQKAIYTAELTFAPDTEGGATGGMAGLASQFGLDIGSGGSSFQGDNLVQLFKSKKMLETTLLTEVDIEGKKQLLVQYYISTKNTNGKPNKELTKVTFSADQKPGDRIRDSVMKSLIKEVSGTLNVGKIDRRLDFVSVSIQHTDELFAKLFVENLTNNVIQYFVDLKSTKSRQNVALLERQTDSVYRLIGGGIASIAATNDLNVNPMRQSMRTGAQRKSVDVQVNTALYGELTRHLELARIATRKETPFIQIIDTPILPLDKKKLGRAKAGVLFGIIGLFVAGVFFTTKRMIAKL